MKRSLVPGDGMKAAGFLPFRDIAFIPSHGAANGDLMLGDVLVLLAGGSFCFLPAASCKPP
jgi:hypothetical protein